ncbi:MAG: phosphoribosylglycinamide formyltransferase [Chloroflexota bacterium]
MSNLTRLVVLISGSGSNLGAILKASAEGRLAANVAAVVSNNPSAFGLERARNAGVPAAVHLSKKSQPRADYDAELAEIVKQHSPDLVILAGWMRILSMAFLEHFPGQVINLHPALPGTFPGAHGIAEAYSAFQAGKISHTGVMIHYVPDEGVDDGPVIATELVPIFSSDSQDDLEKRIHQVEHRLLVSAIQSVINEKEIKNAHRLVVSIR